MIYSAMAGVLLLLQLRQEGSWGAVSILKRDARRVSTTTKGGHSGSCCGFMHLN